MSFQDRYASAVRARNLKSDPDTARSDSDILAAAGLAAKRAPLAMSLMRLLSGDNSASRAVVEELAEMAWGKAKAEHVKLKRLQAEQMAQAVLAWYRHGTCTACGGHGFELIPGTKTTGDVPCKACKGTGRVPFDRQFALERLLIARWLLAEVERQLAFAGPLAMAKLAPTLSVAD